MNELSELNQRIIELDNALDEVIFARAENLANDIAFEEEKRRGRAGAIVGGTVGGGAALAGGALGGAALYGARKNRFGQPRQRGNLNQTNMVKRWQSKGLGSRMKQSLGNLASGKGLAKKDPTKFLKYGAKGAQGAGKFIGKGVKNIAKLWR
jgi:hypothetical protein